MGKLTESEILFLKKYAGTLTEEESDRYNLFKNSDVDITDINEQTGHITFRALSSDGTIYNIQRGSQEMTVDLTFEAFDDLTAIVFLYNDENNDMWRVRKVNISVERSPAAIESLKKTVGDIVAKVMNAPEVKQSFDAGNS